MNKDIRNILLINLALLLVLPLAFNDWQLHEIGITAGFTALGIGGINLVIGVIGLIASSRDTRNRRIAQGFLLGAGLLLLASFTLCTGSLSR